MSQILQSLEVLVSLALREDLGEVGDITSNSTLPHDLEIRGQIRAKADGVIAGLEAVTVVYQQLDPDIQVGLCVEDGARGEGQRCGVRNSWECPTCFSRRTNRPQFFATLKRYRDHDSSIR